MKKLATLAIAMGMVASTYAQGYFNFNNNSAYDGTANAALITVGPQGQAGEGSVGDVIGSEYSVGFEYALGTYATDAAFQAAVPSLSGIIAPGSQYTVTGDVVGGAGIFDGGVASFASTADGAAITVEVLAWWDPSGTTSYAAAKAGSMNTGVSGPISIRLAAGADPVIGDLSTMTGFNVNGVPEPSTLALAGIGAAMLIIRRRK
jgi:hypothetical protein